MGDAVGKREAAPRCKRRKEWSKTGLGSRGGGTRGIANFFRARFKILVGGVFLFSALAASFLRHQLRHSVSLTACPKWYEYRGSHRLFGNSGIATTPVSLWLSLFAPTIIGNWLSEDINFR